MKILKYKNFKMGWIIGDFNPAILKTNKFEICYTIYKRGQKWQTHYHKLGTEYNLLIEGKMTIQNKELNSGDIFILEPYEISNPVYLEDCKIIIVKVPSVPKDKYIIND